MNVYDEGAPPGKYMQKEATVRGKKGIAYKSCTQCHNFSRRVSQSCPDSLSVFAVLSSRKGLYGVDLKSCKAIPRVVPTKIKLMEERIRPASATVLNPWLFESWSMLATSACGMIFHFLDDSCVGLEMNG